MPADKKISALTAIDAVATDDVVVVNDTSAGPVTKKATVTQLLVSAEKLANKDAASGYAGLDATSRLASLDRLPSATASRLLGRRSGSAGSFEEITIGTGLAMSAAGELSNTGASSTPLATEILADTPRAFWKCDDASGGFQDSSGNGYHLTSLTGSLSYQFGHLFGSLPTTKFVHNPDRTTDRYAKGSSPVDAGITAPWNGDLTQELYMTLFEEPDAVNANVIISMGAAGETEATNFQPIIRINPAGYFTMFWEFGAGTNEEISSGFKLFQGLMYQLVCVKDGTANTISFYVNGRLIRTVAYTNEPTGGGSAEISLGSPSTSHRGTWGYVALYNSKLSADRIMAHAIAAGLA